MISTIDELERFFKLCRKQGVTSITFGPGDGVTAVFGDLPKKSKRDNGSEETDIPTDELTDEQLAFYSAGGSNL